MCAAMCKITDLIKIREDLTFSFEITPNMINQIDAIEYEPLFYSITWHATRHECRNMNIAPLNLAISLKRNNKNVLLHLSCHLLKEKYAEDLLIMLRNEGICNLFIILGEKYQAASSDFKSTQELIRYIRRKAGDYFCIGVAAFPDEDEKLTHLKEKIDSGVDFIITQAIFDVTIFTSFLNKCESLNIAVPILPGIFPFETEKEITSFINLCKVRVTEALMEELKNKSGIDIVSKHLADLNTNCNVKHFHFFTMDKIGRTLKLIDFLSRNHPHS